MTVVTGPHRVSPARLAEARRAVPAFLRGLPSPRVAVLVGGDSRHHRWTEADQRRFLDGLASLRAAGASLMITPSRRTPAALAAALRVMDGAGGVRVWDGTGANPFVALLALADAVVVTTDSTNMLGEAAATGRPIQLFAPSGGHRKFDRLADALATVATLAPFPAPLDLPGYPPVDSTPEVAARILALWRAGPGS
jgi:mitochondrial fission protein ELM1